MVNKGRFFLGLQIFIFLYLNGHDYLWASVLLQSCFKLFWTHKIWKIKKSFANLFGYFHERWHQFRQSLGVMHLLTCQPSWPHFHHRCSRWRSLMSWGSWGDQTLPSNTNSSSCHEMYHSVWALSICDKKVNSFTVNITFIFIIQPNILKNISLLFWL